MKQLVILMGTIILGCLIFNLMVGDSHDSMLNVTGRTIIETWEAWG